MERLESIRNRVETALMQNGFKVADAKDWASFPSKTVWNKNGIDKFYVIVSDVCRHNGTDENVSVRLETVLFDASNPYPFTSSPINGYSTDRKVFNVVRKAVESYKN